MIHNILSAYYFNPFKTIKMPLNDTVDAYTLRWLIRGDAELTVGSEKIHLSSGQILICPPHSAVTMRLDEESDVIYSVTAFEGDLALLKSLPLERPITISAIDRELLFQFFIPHRNTAMKAPPYATLCRSSCIPYRCLRLFCQDSIFFTEKIKKSSSGSLSK